MNTSPRSRSFWHTGITPTPYPPLRDNVTADVCVIGGGIAGMTSAWLLSKAGFSVAVLEALDLAAGETSRSTAHIAVPDDRYWVIERDHGIDGAQQVAASFAAAIDQIESIVREARISCDFARVDGYLVSCADDPDAALQRELEAAQRAGVVVEKVDAAHGFSGLGPALRFPHQAQFHPFSYLTGLAAALPRKCALFEGTRALAIDEFDDHAIVRTTGGTVRADWVIVATNTPFNERFGLHVRQFAYQTYVVAGLVPRGSVPQILVWDDGDPYHYIRTAPYDERADVVIVGGEDHKTGHETDTLSSYAALETWIAQHLPALKSIHWHWSGEIIEPLDGLANLGREPGSKRTFVISGDSGNGITHATIGASLISAQIQGVRLPWEKVYDPARSQAKHFPHLLKEQADIASQYTDWLSAGDAPDVGEIGFDSGAVIRHGLTKIAVYRDNHGDLFAHSATCPHLGCIVQWNPAERTWDCPCHGSRFSAYGALLHGPAQHGLSSLNQPSRLERLSEDAAEADEEDAAQRSRDTKEQERARQRNPD